MKNHKVIFILSVILLAGCASYVPPSSGPKATIIDVSEPAFLGIYKNAKICTDYQGLSFAARMVGDAVAIPANELNTFVVSYSESHYYSCQDVVFSFIPKENNNYQVTYEPHSEGLFKDAKCVFKVVNSTTNKEEPVQVRNYRSNFWTGKGSCNDKLAGKIS